MARSTARCTLNQAPLLFTGAAHRRADQIRRQRLPRDQDHLHQRDRRPVRKGRRRRAGGGARHRPRQPHRLEVPACRAGLSAARASPRTRCALVKTAQDHDVPLRIVEAVLAVNDERKRAMARKVVERAAAAACAARRSPCSASPSSPTPTTCARRRRSRWSPALQDMGAKVRALRSGRHGAGARANCPTSSIATTPMPACAGADALVIVTEWEQFRALDLERLKSELAQPVRRRPAQHLPARGHGARTGSPMRASGARPSRGSDAVLPSYPVQAGDPSTPVLRFASSAYATTGSPAFAGDDGCTRTLAPQLRHPAPDRRRARRAVPHARGQQRRRAGGAARRRQDHARAAGAARRAVGEGQEDPRAGAAPARGPRRRRAHGVDAGRARRRDRRLPRALRLEGVARARASRWSPRACSRG